MLSYIIYKVNIMLIVAATRAVRMPANPTAWSSSSRTRLVLGDGAGGGGGGGEAGDCGGGG
jgi:hypothetical protein